MARNSELQGGTCGDTRPRMGPAEVTPLEIGEVNRNNGQFSFAEVYGKFWKTLGLENSWFLQVLCFLPQIVEDLRFKHEQSGPSVILKGGGDALSTGSLRVGGEKAQFAELKQKWLFHGHAREAGAEMAAKKRKARYLSWICKRSTGGSNGAAGMLCPAAARAEHHR